MVIGIIGIVVALIVFLWGAYKNVSVLYLAPIAGIIVAVTNGLDVTQAFTSYHIGAVAPSTADPSVYEVGGVAGMLIQIFPTVFLGGLLGKVMTDSGAADSIATTLVKKFVMPVKDKEKQARVAVLIMLIIEVILTFGGIDGFVAVFATFPICMIIAEHVGIPRRYVPAMLCLSCGANSAPVCFKHQQYRGDAGAAYIRWRCDDPGLHFLRCDRSRRLLYLCQHDCACDAQKRNLRPR